MIEVQSVNYDYPAARALFDVSVSIAAGKVTALVGPNGAGKTTLLRCLAALERPFSGRVLIDGIDTAKDPREVHARLGYLPDFYGLYDELTVARCLTYAARARAMSGALVARAVEKAAARVELTKRLEQRAGELSRGLRQRLAIGMAIVHEPQVVLLDEPAAGLDPEARRSLSNLIRSLADGGATLVVSSHILAELEDYSDQMVMIRNGRIAGGGVVARGGEAGRRTMNLTLTEAVPELAARLGEALPDARVVQVRPTGAVVAIEDSDAAAAGALRALIGAGLPVSSFELAKNTLESAYLSEVGAPGAEGQS